MAAGPTRRIAARLRAEVVDDAVLLLDAASHVVVRLDGEQAAAARHLIARMPVPAELSGAVDVLQATGLVTDGTTDGSMLRRRFLTGAAAATAATGIVVLRLPSAAAAASGGGIGPGGGTDPGSTGQAPNPPSITTTTPGAGSVTFSIGQTDNGGGAITNYEYSIDGGPWTAFSPAQASGPFTITGLTGPAAIRLRAVNATGSSTPSATANVSPIQKPGAVLVTAAQPTDMTTVTLTFAQSGSEPVTGYEGTRNDGSTWFSIATSGDKASFTGTAGGVYRLRAVNAAGAGPASNSTTGSSGGRVLTASGSVTLPGGTALISVLAYGGAGGSGQSVNGTAGGTGGQPAEARGRFTTTAGGTCTVTIGQGGATPTAGTGDKAGAVGGAVTSGGFGIGGVGGGGGGATSISGAGLAVYAGGGGGGGGASALGGAGSAASPSAGGAPPSSGGAGTAGQSGSNGRGGGGGGGGGGSATVLGGLGGPAGSSPTVGGGGGQRGAASTSGLSSAASFTSFGRTIATDGSRSQDGEARFDWITVTVN